MEVLGSYDAALAVTRRSLPVAQSLVDGVCSGVHPPYYVLDAYAMGVERDREQLAELRAKVTQFKAMFRTH